MTTLLKTLVDKLQTLPPEKQDQFASIYLAEFEDDKRWEELFDRTTDEQWEKLAEQARQGKGDSIPLDDFLEQT